MLGMSWPFNTAHIPTELPAPGAAPSTGMLGMLQGVSKLLADPEMLKGIAEQFIGIIRSMDDRLKVLDERLSRIEDCIAAAKIVATPYEAPSNGEFIDHA